MRSGARSAEVGAVGGGGGGGGIRAEVAAVRVAAEVAAVRGGGGDVGGVKSTRVSPSPVPV